MAGNERIRSFQHLGLTFDVVDSGPLDGDPVVLLHGFPQRATSWARVTATLNAAGRRTLALDQRGYSPGARPTRRSDYRLSLIAEDAAALIEQVGPVHLVGHDWGAAAAWAVALRHPELVKHLTSVSVPHPGAFVQSFVSSDQLAKSWYMLFFQLPILPERALASSRAEGMLRAGGMTREMVERYRREIVDDGALHTALHWYRAAALDGPGLMTRRVQVPVTHVWSDGDVAVTRRSAELCEKYAAAGFRLELLEGVSHWIPDEASDRLAEIILDDG